MVIIQFQVKVDINLHDHERVLQKVEIAWAALSSAISALWKTHMCKLIPNWMRRLCDYLLIT